MAFVYIDTSPRLFTYAGAHTHTEWEIILTLEGEGATLIGDQKFPFRPGSVHLVPPNTPHVKQSPAGFKDIYIRVDTLAPYGLGEHTPPFGVEDDGLQTVSTLMKGMLYRYLQENKPDPVIAQMCELVLQLIVEQRSLPTGDPVVEQVRNFLALNYNDPELSLSQALCATGYQKDYVRRRFVAVCGLTPGEYLSSLRMDKAKTLLLGKKKPGLSVADIGAMCGYFDARYFSRAFKKHTGLSPEEYRLSPPPGESPDFFKL